MRLPKFTADASLFVSKHLYRTSAQAIGEGAISGQTFNGTIQSMQMGDLGESLAENLPAELMDGSDAASDEIIGADPNTLSSELLPNDEENGETFAEVTESQLADDEPDELNNSEAG